MMSADSRRNRISCILDLSPSTIVGILDAADRTPGCDSATVFSTMSEAASIVLSENATPKVVAKCGRWFTKEDWSVVRQRLDSDFGLATIINFAPLSVLQGDGFAFGEYSDTLKVVAEVMSRMSSKWLRHHTVRALAITEGQRMIPPLINDEIAGLKVERVLAPKTGPTMVEVEFSHPELVRIPLRKEKLTWIGIEAASHLMWEEVNAQQIDFAVAAFLVVNAWRKYEVT